MGGVLGISIGTRTLGLAVMRGNELIDWRMRTFEGKWSEGKRNDILASLKKTIYRYDITRIAIKIPPLSHYEPHMQELVQQLETMPLHLSIYTIEELKQRYTSERTTKEIFISSLVVQYPELVPLYAKERTNRNPYYSKLFEAIECAHLKAGQ